MAHVIEFYAQAIGAEHYDPKAKELLRIAALFAEGFSEEQICAGITSAIKQAREKGRTANLTFCARIVRSIYSTQSEIVPDNRKSSTGEIVTGVGKSSTQIVPVASKSYAMLLDGLELDECAQTEMAHLVMIVEEHSQRAVTKAEARRWKVLGDDFKELAIARGIIPIVLVRQAVEEALDAGSAREGYCAPKLARSILSRWAKAHEKPVRRRIVSPGSAPSGSKSQAKRRAQAPQREIPPGVQAYREVRRRFPAQEVWDSIAKAVGAKESSLALWREVLKTWVARGYNPMNVEGPLEWFKKREIPQNGSGKSSETTNERRPVESIEVIQARLQHASRAMAGAGASE